MKKNILFLAIIFFLLFLLLSLFINVDWSVLSLFSCMDVLVVAGSLVLETALYTVMVYLLIKGFSYRPKLVDLYLVLTTCLTANYATPFKMGVPLRIFLYKEKLQIPVITGSSIILIEIFLNIFVSLSLSFAGLLTVIGETGINIGFCLPVFVLVLLFFLIRFDLLEIFFAGKSFAFSSFLVKIFSFISRVKKSLFSVSLSFLVAVVFLYLLVFAVQAARLWFVLSLLGDSISVVALLFVLAISTSIGTLSMIPMGIGVKDASLTFLLIHLGVPADTAVVMAAIQRIFSPGWPLLLGLISANILGVSALLQRKRL